MKYIFKTFFLSLCIIANTHFAFAQTASILPPAKTTFNDQNGKPLTAGTVDFYIPGGTTRKTTWKDAAETISNTNPVVLDSAGRALILGSGAYRQVVKDRNGNVIWDQVTSSAGSGSSGPTATGDGDLVGTIKPWAGSIAPAQYVFTYGQEVSRTTYSLLFSTLTITQSSFCTSGSNILSGLSDTTSFWIGMKIETTCVVSGITTITAKTSSSVSMAANANITGNVNSVFFPWGDGNGSTTFNIPDFRGFTIAGNNNMGGIAGSQLNATYFGVTDPNSIGGAGGTQSKVLLTANLPAYTPAGTIANGAITNIVTGGIYASSSSVTSQNGTAGGQVVGGSNVSIAVGSTQATSTFSGIAQGGTSAAFSTVQPTKTSNYIIKITPDVSAADPSNLTVGVSTIIGGTNTLLSNNGGVLANPTFTSNKPLIGNGSSLPNVGTVTGNTTLFATGNGSYISGNCVQSDINHNLVDATIPCGTNTNVSYTQNFVDGVGFTAGTTTSLTVTNTPISSQSTSVYFDGIYQTPVSTWTLAGSVVTFAAAIPTNTKVVVISSVSTAALPTWVSTFNGNSGVVNYDASIDNFLPNVQQQLWSGLNFIPKQNAAGTASQTPASCTSFTTATQSPVFTCANTQQIKVGDLVIVATGASYTTQAYDAFWGYAGASYISCNAGTVQCRATSGTVTSCIVNPNTCYLTAAEVTAVVTNTSITLASSGLGGISPAGTTAATLIPISPGDLGSSTNGQDGWTKTSTLVASVDDFGTVATPLSTSYKGAIRPLLLRKGITGQEIYEWSPSIDPVNPSRALAKYAGRTVTCGVSVYQRVQNGASTWNLHIDDNTGSTSSINGTGASFGGYQFVTVTRTLTQNLTSFVFYLNTIGNSGDVFDVPMMSCFFGSSMTENQVKQNSFEKIKATSHWNPPLLTPYIVTFPGTTICGSCGLLYGHNGINLGAMSFGTVDNRTITNVYGKLEWTGTNPGKNVFFGGNVNVTNGLTFGLQAATQVSGVQFPTSIAPIPIYHDGTVAFYTDQLGLVPTSGTFDFTDVEVTSGNSVN